MLRTAVPQAAGATWGATGRVPTALPLNARTLRYHAGRVSIPAYDRGALRSTVVHIGVGSFHRSHQAVYFDDLARLGLGDAWGLPGVAVHRREMKDVLLAQDGLYTVVSRDDGGDEARVVGVITRCLFVPDQREAVLRAFADESTRRVTLTITADGYRVEPVEGQPTGASAPDALSLIVEALDRRRRRGLAPFTVLSCDNTPRNGALARAAVLAVAERRDAQLADWIAARVAFPSSVVDRITPCTTDADRRLVANRFGVADRWPVVTEPFSQWIIEDNFCNDRPPLDQVGAEFVSDVRPYALMKTRLLNAAHCALGYLGTLAGYERTDQAMGDPALGRYIQQLMDREIVPLLPPGNADPTRYGATVRRRFSNRAGGDQLSRLCRRGSAKVPAHVLSSIAEARAAGRPHPLLTLTVSAWCHYLQGSHPGASGDLADPADARLRALAVSNRNDPAPLLADESTFGALGRCPDFVQDVRRDLLELRASGPRAAITSRMAFTSSRQAA